MSNAPRKTVVTPAAASTALPVIETYGIAPHSNGRGYVVVCITTQGDKVTAREILSVDPESKAHAAARAELEMKKALLLGGKA